MRINHGMNVEFSAIVNSESIVSALKSDNPIKAVPS